MTMFDRLPAAAGMVLLLLATPVAQAAPAALVPWQDVAGSTPATQAARHAPLKHDGRCLSSSQCRHASEGWHPYPVVIWAPAFAGATIC